MSHAAAVLTGDLIASTQAGQSAVDGAMQVIESVASKNAQITKMDIRFARYRGDGWQIFCPDARSAFRLTVLVLANLRSRHALPQTRLSVATGKVSVLPATGLASASGEAFTLSGHALDSMTTQRLAFESNDSDARWQRPLFFYLDWQSSRWSPEQAEAVALAFRHINPQPTAIAADLGISRQAANARLTGAGFRPLLEADMAFTAWNGARP